MDAEARQRLEELIARRGRYGNGALVSTGKLLEAQNLVSFWTPLLVEYERLNKELDAEIKALGFHDVGHAKGELNKTEGS